MDLNNRKMQTQPPSPVIQIQTDLLRTSHIIKILEIFLRPYIINNDPLHRWGSCYIIPISRKKIYCNISNNKYGNSFDKDKQSSNKLESHQ